LDIGDQQPRIMKPEEIQLADWLRVLVGEVPGHFYLEAIFRLLVIYTTLLVSMRLMGRRLASRLSRTEMVAVVALAAATGIPILAPERGLLPAIITAAVVVAGERFISRAAAKSPKTEALVDDVASLLVEDGVMKPESMLRCRVTRDRLMAQLRVRGIGHLGAVRRLYLEANGSFSLLRAEPETPGLSTLPAWDYPYKATQELSEDHWVCSYCGARREVHGQKTCDNCRQPYWTRAVIRIP
jgi:uncharacterized membrane protein YcaP (DUF421 family)